MKKFLNTAKRAAKQFGSDEDGAQVIEYALIIALVSIGLAIALALLDVPINSLQTRLTACLSGGTCTG